MFDKKFVYSFRVAILGDTSYGECCVDGVAAEHVGADSVIHFGDTCFSPTEQLPVLYIFTRSESLDINDLTQRIDTDILRKEGANTEKKVAIFYDVHYHWTFMSSMASKLESLNNIVICHPPCMNTENEQIKKVSKDKICDSVNDQTLSLRCGRLVPDILIDTLESDCDAEDLEDSGQHKWTILYVGENEIYAQYLALTFPRALHMLYQPEKKHLVPSSTNVRRALMKRYFAIEKTKDAERIGILVGTLGVANYCDMIDKCRDTIKRAGKRAYTFLVGKPNAPKLANFPEIDVFVIVACPLNSIELAVGNISEGRDRSGKDFLHLIITPFELDVALNPKRKWINHGFKANYRAILPGTYSGYYIPNLCVTFK